MFKSLERLVTQAEENNVPLHEIILRAEEQQSGSSRSALRDKMHARLEVMRKSANEGLHRPTQTLSGMAGGNAFQFANWLQTHEPLTGPVLSRAIAHALSIGEINAGMGCIVATPTAGSAGIVPAVLLSLQERYQLSDDRLIDGLFTAGGVGIVITMRANVSGAAGGCQAETGSAAAMAAAAAVEVMGGVPRQAANAVAIVLKNMLGLVCDPVAGLVEVPCIKRNAAGVAQALVAVDLVMAGITSTIPADEVIDAMQRVGERMDERLRETAQGGLAATPTGRKLADEFWSRWKA